MLALLLLARPVAAETPEQWVALGERIHGGFGSYIALGLRIGLDAADQLGAEPGQLEVLLIDGPGSPCPCLADGLMLSTRASPGRGTLRVASEKAAADEFGVVVVRDRSSGEGLRYVVPMRARAKLDEWNRTLAPLARYHATMSEPEEVLFLR
ncbi:MAG: formylmethanofuran dehydrogenase subunit E family protein, partial [Burkholderiales bacterium]|nr:formylmethanofuran dehydrogenase subunit E family protein [Burkholderiales bacterium]